MRNISLTLKQFIKPALLALGLVILGFSTYAQGDLAKGKAIFQGKCTACHAVDKQVVGPALGPQLDQEPDEKWLIKWVQNNQALIAAKDPKAVAIYNKFNQSNMTLFADLSDADVSNILAYVRDEWKKDQQPPVTPAGAAVAEKGPSNIMILGLIGVIVVAFIIILVLNKVIKTLEKLILNKPDLLLPEPVEPVVPVDRYATVKKLIKNKKFVFFVLLCVSIAGGGWTWMTMWNTNIHQGYQPVQPIKFPHDLHAGAMQIKCQYCHSGAYKSKNATIPSLNICMNCHKTISARMGAKTPSTEIAKIYDALGYDPQTQKYDSTKAHPIQWIRIHNLPDLVYFNHSQHAKVAGLKCQTCHGPVETMKEVYQYSPLTMKWCIQCHKRTGINYKDNGYYEKMEAIHDRIKRGDKITEAEMGGIECAKCHY
ncbi:MAG: c-type cytochrome [Bacteroidetes bacterium]|nr:c-type cytochrome [Bacteroidota bacterium]